MSMHFCSMYNIASHPTTINQQGGWTLLICGPQLVTSNEDTENRCFAASGHVGIFVQHPEAVVAHASTISSHIHSCSDHE